MKSFSLLISVILIVAAQAIEYKHEHGYKHEEHGYKHLDHGYKHEDHGYKHEDHGYKHEEHGPVEYEFHYSVHDPHTGDIKSQKEKRKDDKVEGSYELIDSDGHRRIVHYKADDHKGFEAVVIREPTDIKIPIPEHHEYHHQEHEQQHAKIVTHSAPIVHYGHKGHQEGHHDYHYKF